MIFDTSDLDLDVVLENWSCQRMSQDLPSCLESESLYPSIIVMSFSEILLPVPGCPHGLSIYN